LNTHIQSRFKIFGLHLSGSLSVLALALGGLYLGWYRWPGWYLADALHIAVVIASADVLLGPSLTLLIANPDKPRRVLGRDIAVIVVVQLAALIYGAVTLWQGRPLYYTFSSDRLELVAASDIDRTERALARTQNSALAPTWHSTPRWVWAPLPADDKAASAIVSAAIFGGKDVIQMPRYFKEWEQGLPELRKQLKAVDKMSIFSKAQKQRLKERMAQRGFASDQPIAMVLMGPDKRLLAVFNPSSLHIEAIIRAD
jgi:hypothetical protein